MTNETRWSLQYLLDGIVVRRAYKTRKGYKMARNFFKGMITRSSKG